jgi:hypothetical protein
MARHIVEISNHDVYQTCDPSVQAGRGARVGSSGGTLVSAHGSASSSYREASPIRLQRCRPSHALATNFGLTQSHTSYVCAQIKILYISIPKSVAPHYNFSAASTLLSLVKFIKPLIMSDTRTITDAEWAVHKEAIERLYQNKTLSEVMALMEQDHGFIAKLVTQIPNTLTIKLTQVEEKLNTPGNSSNGTFRKTLQVTNGNSWLENWRSGSKKARRVRHMLMGN